MRTTDHGVSGARRASSCAASDASPSVSYRVASGENAASAAFQYRPFMAIAYMVYPWVGEDIRLTRIGYLSTL